METALAPSPFFPPYFPAASPEPTFLGIGEAAVPLSSPLSCFNGCEGSRWV